MQGSRSQPPREVPSRVGCRVLSEARISFAGGLLLATLKAPYPRLVGHAASQTRATLFSDIS
jgi:hypothetical protein